MSIFDRFRSPEKLRQRNLAKLEEQERIKRNTFQERERERTLMARAKWSYSEQVDEMRGTKMRLATLMSCNQVHFGFPYSGGSNLLITLRRRGQMGEALLSVSSGQFDHDVTYHQIGKFKVNAKPDQRAINSWYGAQPEGGSLSLMFLENPFDFIRMVQKAETLILEPSFYQHGPVQFRFNPIGLDKGFWA